MASPREIAATLVRLGEVFGRELSPTAMKSYAAALGDVDSAALAEAERRLVREAKYFPFPVEIREAAGAGSAPRSEPVGIPYFPPAERSLEEIAENRRRVAPLWGEVRRVLHGGALRPFSEVLADLEAGRLGDDPADG